jgi:hypothetical protein
MQDYPNSHHHMHSKNVIPKKLNVTGVNKMSDIKTVTHEGKVYQIGGVYEFSDAGKDWTVDELLSVGDSSIFPFNARQYEWELIREVNCTIGTITPAPVELVDGAAYTFDYHKNRKSSIGVYSKFHNTFLTVGHDYFVFDCTNIRLMTVESK